MTIRDLANRLANALHRDHGTLVQHYAVPYFEYTLHRELNSLVRQPEKPQVEAVAGEVGHKNYPESVAYNKEVAI